MSEKYLLAIYRLQNQIDFVKLKYFDSLKERRIFAEALDMNAKYAVGSRDDTSPFLTSYNIPEEIDQISFDDDIYDRLKKSKFFGKQLAMDFFEEE